MTKKKWNYSICTGVLMVLAALFATSGKANAAESTNIPAPEYGRYSNGVYEYDIIKKGTAIRLEAYLGNESKIVTPKEINGIPVKRIGSHTFWMKKKIKEVKISDGVEVIGASAFGECSNLKKVTIPKSVRKVMRCAFDECKKLSVISGGKGITYVGDFAFTYCESLKKIPDFPKVTDWLEYTFSATALEKVVVPKSVQICAQGQFYGCKKLKKVVIKDAGYYIWKFMFFNSRVKEIDIQKGGEIIKTEAFSECTRLKKITLSNTTKRIDSYAFKNCKSLRKLNIPKSVKKIHKTAFEGCSKKLTIYCKKNSTAHKYAKKHHMKYKIV